METLIDWSVKAICVSPVVILLWSIITAHGRTSRHNKEIGLLRYRVSQLENGPTKQHDQPDSPGKR